MTIFQIKCFLALYDKLNFTVTSQCMYTNQPFFSRQIAAFEKELNVKLFNRNSHTVSPTLAAKVIYAELKPIPSIIETVKAKATAIERSISGNLQIGILDSLNENLTSLENLREFIR